MAVNYIRPDADTSAGNWTSTGASLFSVVDESAADDNDYISVLPVVMEARLLNAEAGTDIQNATITVPAPDNCLLVVLIYWETLESGPFTKPTVSGASLTWTERISFTPSAGGAPGYAVWTAPVTTGGDKSISINGSPAWSGDAYGRSIYAVTGYDTASPFGATAVECTSGSLTGAKSVAFSATPASDSILLGFGGMDNYLGNLSHLTPGTGWTSDFAEHTNEWVTFRAMSSRGDLASALNFANAQLTSSTYTFVGVEIKAAIPPGNRTKLSLSNPGVVPAMPMYVRFRAQKDADFGTMSIAGILWQGSTQIATWTEADISTTPTTYEYALTQGEFDSITDFTNLSIELMAIYTP